MSDCVSRFVLMQLQAGDLSKESRAATLQHIESCERCSEAYLSLQENVALFEQGESAHLERLMPRIDHQSQTNRRQRFRKIATWTSAAAAAVALFILVFFMRTTPVEDEVIAFKGGLSVSMIAQREGRQFEVKGGTHLRENDALRFVVTTAQKGYLFVFSVDATGRISSYYPESDPLEDPAPLKIDQVGRHALPGSVVLDDAVGEEAFVVIFSLSPFRRDSVVEDWGADKPSLATGKEMLVEEITVIKEKIHHR